MTIQQRKASQEWFEKLRHETIKAFLSGLLFIRTEGNKNKVKV